MEIRIDPDAPLDYIELQIFPSYNRYEASASTSNRAEKVASGDLQQLLYHLPQVKDLSSKSSDSNFKILPPDNVNDTDWFTAAKLIRFLLIVGSPDILRISNEISQLVETRKFQLSLFARAEVDMTSSFESKNELLRTVDLRLSELKEKFSESLNQATGAICLPKDISDLENLAHHLGAEEIRDSLQKILELTETPSSKDSTSEITVCASQLNPNPPVTYGVSPAKAAQIERQSSTDTNSSFSSEEDEQPSVERSRNVTRSFTPKRSASPMRRIQIGRSGQRRSTSLNIKSLNLFPKEKTSVQRDVGSEEDESNKRNALRMSVQDKISLFENKKKGQDVETQKPKTIVAPAVATKAVLRRWSSGMGESTIQSLHDTSDGSSSPITPNDAAPPGNAEKNGKLFSPENGDTDLDYEKEGGCEKHPDSIEWNKQKEAELNQMFKNMMESKPVKRQNTSNDNSKNKNSQKETRGGFYDHYKQKRDEKLRKEASGKKAEKEAQFKEMQQFLDQRKAEMASTNTSDVTKKLDTTTNKPKNLKKKPTTQLPNPKKEASKPSVVKKTTSSKLSNLPAVRKSWPSTPLPRTTGTSPAKTPSGVTNSSSGAPIRKSQPALSAVRATAKIEKVQPRIKTPKKTQPDNVTKNVKTISEKKQPIIEKAKTRKAATPIAATAAATTTTTARAKPSFYNKVTKKGSVVPLETKPFLRKGTGIGPGVVKKVVAQPEEPIGSGDLVQSEKAQVVETNEITGQNQKECEPVSMEPTKGEGSETRVVSPSPSPTKCRESETPVISPSPRPTKCKELGTPVAIPSPRPTKCKESETPVASPSPRPTKCKESVASPSPRTTKCEETVTSPEPTKCEESKSFNELDVCGVKKVEYDNNKIVSEEESMISPTAWVEKEDDEEEHDAIGIIPCKVETTDGGGSSPRVRHSLFQMLLEETGEGDSCEWGNAPAMVCQKDAPKGLKRLLKFARKTKADLLLSDGSSPSSIFRRG